MSTLQKITVAMLCCTSGLWSFGIGHAQEPATTTQAPPASNSSVLHVDQAQIKCMHKMQIAAQSDGLIEVLMADEGSVVQKGDLLLKIDDRLAVAELAVAKKEHEAAQAQGKQTAEIEYAKLASAVSREEYNEYKDLFERSKSASFSEVRKKKLEADRAAAGVKVAEVNHQKDEFSAEVAREKVGAASVQLELRKVTAPRGGVIVERLRDQGEWIKAGEPIFRLLDLSEMKVEAQVSPGGSSIASLQNAPMKIRVPIGGEQELVFDARIDFVSSEIEVNGDVRVWARIQNQMLGDSWVLRDGAFCSADISVDRPALTAKKVAGN